MYVIAGLGNPGKKYENTRHNMGFMVLDRLSEKYDIKINKIKHKALIGQGFIGGKKVMLVKPQTYMNESGQSLREVAAYYDVATEDLLVVYDDFDIAVGNMRIRAKGSAGSHNGMKSIIYHLQDDKFPRIRIGIGASGPEDWKDHVLGQVSKEDMKTLNEVIDKAVEAIACYIEKDINVAMNKYNIKPKREKALKEAKEAKAEANTPVKGEEPKEENNNDH